MKPKRTLGGGETIIEHKSPRSWTEDMPSDDAREQKKTHTQDDERAVLVESVVRRELVGERQAFCRRVDQIARFSGVELRLNTEI